MLKINWPAFQYSEGLLGVWMVQSDRLECYHKCLISTILIKLQRFCYPITKPQEVF